MLVLSKLDFAEFGASITDPANSIGAPRFLYTQLDLNIDEFLSGVRAESLHAAAHSPTSIPPSCGTRSTSCAAAGYKSNKGLLPAAATWTTSPTG